MAQKLYTEEQVNELRRALKDIAQWDEFLEDDWEDAGNRAMDALRCFKKLTPIELPSDEEIEKFAFEKYHSVEDSRWFEPLKIGAKWMRNKILNK